MSESYTPLVIGINNSCSDLQIIQFSKEYPEPNCFLIAFEEAMCMAFIDSVATVGCFLNDCWAWFTLVGESLWACVGFGPSMESCSKSKEL